MPLERLDSLLHYLLRRARPRLGDDVTDGTLLERFIREREEAAFTALVDRHGPMVFGVCRRVLGHHQDAEDVFQAAFLILARRAASLRRADSVAPWLHTVAYRLALHAHAARRPTEDGRNLDMLPAEPDSAAVWRDLRPVLDEELQRLPEKYRVPVVLCYLEGRTHTEAAQQLGWPKGTVAGRLARAREVLRERLTRRGITLSAGLLGTVLAEQAATAVPAALVRLTIRGAVAFAAASTAGVSAKVLALAEGGLQAMFATKVKVGAALALAFVLTLAGAGTWAHQALYADPIEEPVATAWVDRQVPRGDGPPGSTDRYGDPLPTGAVARLGTARWRRAGEGLLRVSPDGKLLATAQRNHGVSVLEVRTGRRLHTFPGHGIKFDPVGFSPDGKRLTTLDFMGALHTWDLASGKEVSRHQLTYSYREAHLSPDGTLLANDGKDGVRLLRMDTGQEVRVLEDSRQLYHRRGTFSPEGKFLAGSVFTSVQDGVHHLESWLWEVATGKKVRRFGDLQGLQPGLAFSGDGRLLATVAGKDPLRLWDVATGQEVRRFPDHSRGQHNLAFTRDNQQLVSSGKDSPIHVWDVGTGRELRRFGEASEHLVILPDDTVATTRLHTIRLWDPATGKEVRASEGQYNGIRAAAFSQDGASVVTADLSGEVRTWEAATGRPLDKRQVAPDRRIGLSANGRFLASTETTEQKTISLRAAATGSELRLIALPEFGPNDSLRGRVFSPDGTRIAISYGTDSAPKQGDQTFRLGLWDVATAKELWRHAGVPMGFGLTFSRDGWFLAFRNRNRGPYTFHVWEAAGGREFTQFMGTGESGDSWENLALSPSGRLLAAPCQNHPQAAVKDAAFFAHLCVWEVASGRELAALGGHYGTVDVVVFAPDGRTLASAHREGPSTGAQVFPIRLWDVASCQEVACLRGHAGMITSLAFSPDGRRLISGSYDTTVLVWDVAGVLPRQPRPAPAVSQDLESTWAALAGGDAQAARRALHALASVPELTVPLLHQRLKPASAINPEQLARWVQDLDDTRFKVRDRATRDLEAAGHAAERFLTEALAQGPSAELRQRVEGLLKKLRGPVTEPKLLQAIRAVEVLEHIGTPAARAILKTLADGAAEARLTREAKGALRFLAGRAAK